MNEHLNYYQDLADRYDTYGKKLTYYNSLLRGWLRYVIPEGRSVLDLGCGDGAQVMSLNPSVATGIDFSPRMLALACKRYSEGRWILHDLTSKMPPIAQEFDYIVATDLVGYLQDIQNAMEEILKLCGPKTRVVITKTNPFWGFLFRIASWIGLAEPRRYSNWLTRQQCQNVLELAGFEIINMGKFCLLPIRIPFVSTLVNRTIAHLPLINRLALVEYFICRMRPKPCTKPPSVSVIIPARNERGNIRPALQRMPRFPGKLEVIFIEGHSKDGTWEEIHHVTSESWPFVVHAFQQTGKGKGDAVRLGFAEATGDLLMILDADLTVPPEELPRFYRMLADRRAEYVHGTRLVYPMENQAMRPLNWMGNQIFSRIFSFLLGQNMSDTLCGTKCMWRDGYQRLAKGRTYFGDFDPFGDFDLIFGASKLSLKIAEIPVHYKSRVYGETQIRRFRDGMLLFHMCWFAARRIYFI